MKKLLCIVGPTASGKTALAQSIAKLHEVFLLSADSRQVYRGLDVVSGKDIPHGSKFEEDTLLASIFSPKYFAGYYLLGDTPIYLTDIVNPTYNFSVHDYIHVLQGVLTYKKNDQALPILVGGSGFYINSSLYGIDTLNIPQNLPLRIGLEGSSVEDLQKILINLDSVKFESLNNSDRNNPVRLVRAIEVAQSKSKLKGFKGIREYDLLVVGLKKEREKLKSRIHERVQQRIAQGAFDEVERLYKNYNNLSRGVKSANGYKQIFEYFSGVVSKNEAIENWTRSEYLNAKKQMTWFGKDKNIVWIDVDKKNFESIAFKIIQNWLNI